MYTNAALVKQMKYLNLQHIQTSEIKAHVMPHKQVIKYIIGHCGKSLITIQWHTKPQSYIMTCFHLFSFVIHIIKKQIILVILIISVVTTHISKIPRRNCQLILGFVDEDTYLLHSSLRGCVWRLGVSQEMQDLLEALFIRLPLHPTHKPQQDTQLHSPSSENTSSYQMFLQHL